MGKTKIPSPASPTPSARHPLRQTDEGKAGNIDAARINAAMAETLEYDDEAFHEYLKTLPKPEAQAQFQARVTRQHEQQRRLVNNVFQFWIVCQDGACERVKACAGDPHACHQRWWKVVPERSKVKYRAYVRARADGRSHEDASAFVEAELERLADHIARVEAEQMAWLDRLEAAERAQPIDADQTSGAAPAEAPPQRARGPRVSVL
jgi:hypothetical protein